MPRDGKASGETRFRMPPALHRDLRRRVKAGEASSLNELILGYVAAGADYPLRPDEKRGRGNR